LAHGPATSKIGVGRPIPIGIGTHEGDIGAFGLATQLRLANTERAKKELLLQYLTRAFFGKEKQPLFR
jgi:hypothetical protein